jgi:heme/copper-type cytochrome/quinol oxidase subunit 4
MKHAKRLMLAIGLTVAAVWITWTAHTPSTDTLWALVWVLAPVWMLALALIACTLVAPRIR